MAAQPNGCTTTGTATTCFCDTDLCNGTEASGIKPLIAIIASLFAIVFRKMIWPPELEIWILNIVNIDNGINNTHFLNKRNQ